MDLKRKYPHLIPSILVATSLILSACQEAGQTRVRIAKGGADTGRIEATERSKLTQEQERYAQDPVKLPSYVHVLGPIFLKLDKEASIPWSSLYRLKRWIITPKDIKKEVPSPVSVSKDTTGEYARQTMYDVFIDNGVYEKGTESVQADILLNEFLTALYTFKNFPDIELCKLVKTEYKDIKGCDVKKIDEENIETETEPASEADSADSDSQAAARKKDPPKKVPPARKTTIKILTEEDYNKIKIIKQYILEQGEKLSHKVLVSMMQKNGFDVRVLSYQMEPKKVQDPLTLNSETIQSLFDQADALNQTKQNCYFIKTEMTSSCEVSTLRKNVNNSTNGKTSIVHKIELKLPGKEAFFSEIVYQMREVKVMKFQGADGKEELYLIPLSGKNIENPAEGVPYRMNYMMASKNVVESKETWVFEGLVSVPGIVTKVGANGNPGEVKCEGKVADVKDEATDILLLSGSKYFDTIKANEQSLPAYPPCW